MVPAIIQLGLPLFLIILLIIYAIYNLITNSSKTQGSTKTKNNMITYTKVNDCYQYELPTTKHYRLEPNPYFVNSIKNKINLVFKPLNLKQGDASAVLDTKNPFGGQLFILANGGLRFISSNSSKDKTSSSNMIKFNDWNTLSITSDGKFYVNNVLAFNLNTDIVLNLIANYYPLKSITVCKY